MQASAIIGILHINKANNTSLKSSKHNNNALQTNRLKDNIREDSTYFTEGNSFFLDQN